MFTLPDEAEQGALPGLTPQATSVTQNTICIVVKKGRFGTRRKASTDDVKFTDGINHVAAQQPDKALYALSKNILHSPELKKVQQADGEISRYLKELCLKSMFRGGVYLIPIGLVEEVNDALLAFSTKRADLVAEAVKTYDTRTAETSARLKVLHEPSDYPTSERFAQKFYFEWQFVTWETPTRLRAIRPALFKIEQEKAAAKLSAVADECRIAMRAGLKELVDHMVDRLTPGHDKACPQSVDPQQICVCGGQKKKKFSKRTIENFHDFFRTFEMKNVTDDTELAAVVTKAKQVLAGVNVDGLKKDEAIRAAIAQQFELIKNDLNPMTTDIDDRNFELDDDEDDT